MLQTAKAPNEFHTWRRNTLPLVRSRGCLDAGLKCGVVNGSLARPVLWPAFALRGRHRRTPYLTSTRKWENTSFHSFPARFLRLSCCYSRSWLATPFSMNGGSSLKPAAMETHALCGVPVGLIYVGKRREYMFSRGRSRGLASRFLQGGENTRHNHHELE